MICNILERTTFLAPGEDKDIEKCIYVPQKYAWHTSK